MDTVAYTMSALDPEDGVLTYMIAWGDTSSIERTSDYASGTKVVRKHVFRDSGSFALKVKARNAANVESDWSDGLTVNVGFVPPVVPSAPTGPTSATAGTSCGYTASSSSQFDDSCLLQFDWGDTTSAWLGPVANDSACTGFHAFDTIGAYQVRVRAKDLRGTASAWSPSLLVAIGAEPPVTPGIPVGPDSGYARRAYSFSTSTTDPLGRDIAYRFDWGDGDTTSWSAFYYSGDSCTLQHTFGADGSYSVRAQAKNRAGVVSAWSSEHPFVAQGTGYPYREIGSVRIGDEPLFAKCHPNGQLVYVTRSNGGVTVINTTNDSVVAVLGVGGAGIDVTPDGSALYLTNLDAQTVSVVRTSDYSVAAVIGVGRTPSAVAVSPDGRFAYVTEAQDNSVGVIRTSDYAVVAHIPVGAWPGAIALLPDGQYAYVACTSDGSVSVIRTQDLQVVCTVPAGALPWDVSVSPDGRYVYVTHFADRTLQVIRTEDNTVVATVPTGGIGCVCVLPSGEYVFTSAYWDSSTVTVVRVSDFSAIETLQAGEWPRGLAVLPSGEKVYVANQGDDYVTVFGY